MCAVSEGGSEHRPSESIPLRSELEQRLRSTVVTFDDDGQEKPGGMCNCCGSGPDVAPSWRGDPWYIYQAGLCDSDGVFYSMLCEGCLEDIRDENGQRPQTIRDQQAAIVAELLGDDL